MNVGRMISVARKNRGLSQRALALAAGVSNPLVSQIETGKVREPGFATVVRLCYALDIDINRAASTVQKGGAIVLRA